MLKKSTSSPKSTVLPMGFCSGSSCKKGCDGASGSASTSVRDDNTNSSGY